MNVRNCSLSIILFLCICRPVFSQTDSTHTETTRAIKRVDSTRVIQSKNWLDQPSNNATSLISFGLAFLSICLSLYQFISSERWKRQDAMMNRVESFHVTPGSHNAMQMIDSPDRDIALWDKDKPQDRYERVLRKQVIIALLSPKILEHTYSDREQAIRDSFNDFLGRIKHIEVYRKRKLIKKKDIGIIIGHSLKDIRDNLLSVREEDKLFAMSLLVYIAERQIEDVINFFERHEIKIKDVVAEYEKTLEEMAKTKSWKRHVTKKDSDSQENKL